METPAKNSRANLAIQVIKHTNNGLTVVDACKEVGLPRSSFYDIVKRNPQIIVDYQEIINKVEFQELMMILITQTEALEKVLQAALDATTSPKDRLAIVKYMDEKENELRKKFAKSSPPKDSARDFLTGPATRRIQPRSSFRTNPDTK
jgi:hypothetical protein